MNNVIFLGRILPHVENYWFGTEPSNWNLYYKYNPMLSQSQLKKLENLSDAEKESISSKILEKRKQLDELKIMAENLKTKRSQVEREYVQLREIEQLIKMEKSLVFYNEILQYLINVQRHTYTITNHASFFRIIPIITKEPIGVRYAIFTWDLEKAIKGVENYYSFSIYQITEFNAETTSQIASSIFRNLKTEAVKTDIVMNKKFTEIQKILQDNWKDAPKETIEILKTWACSIIVPVIEEKIKSRKISHKFGI